MGGGPSVRRPSIGTNWPPSGSLHGVSPYYASYDVDRRLAPTPFFPGFVFPTRQHFDLFSRTCRRSYVPNDPLEVGYNAREVSARLFLKDRTVPVPQHPHADESGIGPILYGRAYRGQRVRGARGRRGPVSQTITRSSTTCTRAGLYQPWALWKGAGELVLPYANWRGQFSLSHLPY